MALISALQRGLLGLARAAYRLLPGSDAAKKRLRFWLKTRLGMLFGRRRAWSYGRWVRAFDTPTAQDARAAAAWVQAFAERPRFTVIVPVPHGRVSRRQALACLRSVREQLYSRRDILACGPGAHDKLLAEAGFAGDAAAARAVPVQHRSATEWIRAGLAAAPSPWIVLLRHDALLRPDALALLAAALRERPEAQALYGDEDGLTETGSRVDPAFKPRFNPDLLLAQDYFGPVFAVHRSALERVGGIRHGFGESVVYELMLRLGAQLAREELCRVPFVLTHRQSQTAAGTGGEEQRRAVLDHLAQQHVAVDGVDVLPTGDLHVRYALGEPPPPVTLIVPTRDRVDLLRACVTGLLHKTDYPALDVIVVDNQSRDPATHAYFRELAGEPRVRILPYDAPFHFSRMNNLAAREARGTLIGLINNDIAVIRPGWLRELAGHALRPEVGAVGAKLLYGDGTIQHAGIVLGMLGFTGHVYRHLPGDAPGHGRRLLVAQEVAAVTGACLVVRRELYLAVGGLDETMPVSCSDVDLCLRLAERGHRTVFTPHAVLHHLESVSRGYERAPGEWEETRREEAVLRERWGARLAEDPCYSPNLTLDSEQPSPAVPPRVRRPWRSG